MCGISGWVDYGVNIQNEAVKVQKMAETLSKRGPDESNIWLSTHCGFGHKRLAVVDLEGGKQPMNKAKGEEMYTLCYNGELYNTEDIRKELLKRGYTFQGHSDTEVLLTSYIEWKEKCLDFLNGIFAFAIWDSQRDHVFIARDRLGVKPLFYKEDFKRLLFASEVKAILAHPDVKAELTEEGLSEIFGLGPSRTPGNGVFNGVKELRPGHAMTFSKKGVKIWEYWEVTSKKHTDSLDETIEKVRFLVKDAIVRQLVSDVPLCTFLSGGVDSSAITAIASNHNSEVGKGKLTTYSIDYEDNEKYFKSSVFQPNSDAPWIELMSNTFETNHKRCVISNEELVNLLEEATICRDLPGMADVDSSLLWFCRQIKKDFVVSLSGECADEIFGGYPWFHREEDLNRSAFPWMRSTEARQKLLKNEWNEKLNLAQYVQDRFDETVKETPLLEGESHLESKRRQLFYLNKNWFMAQLLDRKDRMSMGASLEVRVPFADHRLVEYVWNIPWEMKMLGNREKGILRKALDGILPEEILYRKKSPYPKTHNPIYTKLVVQLLKESLSDKGSALYEFLDKDELTHLVESEGNSFKTPWYGQLMSGPQLLAYLYQIHVWFKKYGINVKA